MTDYKSAWLSVSLARTESWLRKWPTHPFLSFPFRSPLQVPSSLPPQEEKRPCNRTGTWDVLVRGHSLMHQACPHLSRLIMPLEGAGLMWAAGDTGDVRHRLCLPCPDGCTAQGFPLHARVLEQSPPGAERSSDRVQPPTQPHAGSRALRSYPAPGRGRRTFRGSLALRSETTVCVPESRRVPV